MRNIAILALMAAPLLAQLPKPGGSGGGGGGGTPPYAASFSAATSLSVTAATHGKGTNAVVEACYDNQTPRQSFAYTAGYPRVAANGDVTLAWTGSKTGVCYISAGDSGGTGPAGATGPQGDTGPQGPAGNDGADGIGADVGSAGQLIISQGAGNAPIGDNGLAFNTTTDSLGVIGSVVIGQSGTATGELRINGLTSGTVTLKTADAAGTYSLTLPGSAPTGVLKASSGTVSVVTGTATDCVLVDGTSGACGSGGVSDGDKGDITVSSSGTNWQIDAGAVGNTEVASGIDAVKIGAGGVTNTEFGYLGNVTSDIQGQIDALSVGSATAISGLSNCKVTVSGDTLTISTPCVLVFGGVPTTVASTATCVLSGTSSSGSMYVYGHPDSGLTCDENTSATNTPTNAAAATTGAFPTVSYPIATAAFTSNSFTGTVDLRTFVGGHVPVAGTGISVTEIANGTKQIAVDATVAIIPTMQSGAYNYCRSTTGNDTYTCTLSQTLTTYTRGMCVVLDADTANTTTATLAIDGLSAISILTHDGSSLASGDIVANEPKTICFDGTNFLIQGDGGGVGGGDLSAVDIDTFAELDAIVADKSLVNKEDGAVWLGVHNFGGATSLEIPNGTTVPGSCNAGEIFQDTDATSGQQIYGCEGGTYVLQGDGGGGGGLANVVEDTTPQLGGNLDAQTFTITGVGGLQVAGTPSASATAALATIGESSFSSGHASGQYLGIRAPSGNNASLLTVIGNTSVFAEILSSGAFRIAPSAAGASNATFTAGGSSTVAFWSNQAVNTAANRVSIAPSGIGNSSGTMNLFNIDLPDSTSSTGGYNGILINKTGSGTGSGAKKLINLQVGGASVFDVDVSGLATASGNFAIGNGATSAGVMTIKEDTDDGSNFASFSVPALSANTVYVLPPDDGDAGEQLTTDGSGNLTWEVAGSGSVVGSDTQVIFNDGGSAYGGDAGLTYNKTTDVLTVAGGIAAGGGGAAGGMIFTEGTACTPSTNELCIYAPADITTAYGIVLPAASATGLWLGTNSSNVNTVSFVGSTTVGQVMRVGSGPTIAFGAVDLADSDAVTGLLPDANIASTIARDSEVAAAYQPLDAALTALAAGSDFVQFTGPTTSTKVFTLPNATATILTTNTAVTVAQGGSGAATLTGLLQGNGTSAFTAITNSTTVGQTLRVTGSNTYGWGALDLADTDAVTGTLPAANYATMVGDSGAGGTKGAVPAPASGDAAAGRFLKADGTWAVPPGGGVGCVTAGSNNQILTDDGATGCASEAAAQINNGVLFLGTAGSVVGAVDFANGTSGSITIQPPTGALGIITQTLQAASGTIPSIQGTLAVASGKTLTASNTLTFTGTDSSSVAFGAGGTVLYSGGALGTPSSGTLTNATGLPVSTGISGLGTGVATVLATPSFTNLVSAITGDTPVGRASTDTLTNKAIDAEGTGNTLTISTKVPLPLVGCAGTTGSLMWDTLASLAPTATCSAGSTETNMMRGVADFPDSDGDYSVQMAFPLPSDWSGNVDLKFFWRAAATTGDVVWQAQTACRADAEVDDVAWNTASTVTDTTKGTANQLNTATISALTTTGCAAGEIMHLRVLRNRTHASDSITGVVSLGHVEATLRRAI